MAIMCGMQISMYSARSRARVNVKEADVQTPGSTVFVVWNARGFDFWRMNRRTYSTFRYVQSPSPSIPVASALSVAERGICPAIHTPKVETPGIPHDKNCTPRRLNASFFYVNVSPGVEWI